MPAAEIPEKASPATAGWGLIVLLAALTAFAPLAIDMYLPAFPEIARELGVELGTVEFTVSIFLAGMAAGQLIYGPLADRYGRRRPLLAGSAIFAVAALGCAAAHGIGALLAGRLLMALGARRDSWSRGRWCGIGFTRVMRRGCLRN